jgi:hypothetical protein
MALRRAPFLLALSTIFALFGFSVASPASTTTTTTTTTLATTTTAEPTTTTVPTTTLGPNGVISSAILAENRLPGTRAWRMAADTSKTAIQGFANVTYAQVGENVKLYVTTHATTFRAVAYRMGWYQGLGARQVWASSTIPGTVQPACPVDPSTNMVSCDNWRVSLTMPITTAFVPGDYLIKLVAGPRAASYVLLTVWDPASTAAYVIMNRSFVEQGWNTFGGYSYYAGVGPCILDDVTYPPCNRARVVSFDRPYDTGSGSSDFLTNEYPLVQLCEKEGLDVTYITDVTLDEHPTLLLHHRALLSLDHDESWSYAERLGVVDAQKRGVNVVYFGAAAMVRHVRLQPSPLGPDREEVDYRDGAEDPLNGVGSPMEVTGNTWESPPADWSPLGQIGVEYSGYLNPGVTVPMVIDDASSWVFKNTGLRDGSELAGVIGSDFDHVIPSSLTPSNEEVLAHSPIPTGEATVSGAIWGGSSYSDMVYFTNPTSEAGVIDTGNNIWIGDLRSCSNAFPHCAEPTIARVTNNILWLFGQGPAGALEPASSNLSAISPTGS